MARSRVSDVLSRFVSDLVFGLGIGAIIIGIAILAIGLLFSTLTVVSVGVAFISVGLVLYTRRSHVVSDKRMQAMANLEFHEKIAMMKGYMGNWRERLYHDIHAAGELEQWVKKPGLKQQFEEARRELEKSIGRKPIVVKIGGSTLGSHDTTLEDLVALQREGKAPVVVHGGGNVITEWLSRQGIPTRFEKGLRVTDHQTLQVVVAVLAGLVNKELVAAIHSLGGRAMGLSGVDGGFIEARVRDEELGYVGDIVKINPEPLEILLKGGYIPIVAPLGFEAKGEKGEKLNVNADTAAAEIAAAIVAERLIFLTDVAGVIDSSGKLLPRLSPAEASSLTAGGVVSGGMIPKVEACLRALSAVPMAQIVDGRERHALIEAVAGRGGGTTIA